MNEFYKSSDYKRLVKSSIRDLLLYVEELRQKISQITEERDELRKILDKCGDCVSKPF